MPYDIVFTLFLHQFVCAKATVENGNICWSRSAVDLSLSPSQAHK